jgi:hypothetical protein
MPDDAVVARHVLAESFRGTAYLRRMEEVLESALRFEDPEYLCLLAEPENGSEATGLVLFGAIVGARLAVKLHGVVAVDPRVMLALLDAVRETCVRSGERLIVCDGVALRLMVWRPEAGGAHTGA